MRIKNLFNEDGTPVKKKDGPKKKVKFNLKPTFHLF